MLAQDMEISEATGFMKTKALPFKRRFMFGVTYIPIYGNKVNSYEKQGQIVKEDDIVMFDKFDKDVIIGYPVGHDSFAKYIVLEKAVGSHPGLGEKRDDTIYLSRQMDEPFSALVWNGEELFGKVGDYLVVNLEKSDYRVINKDVFQNTYEVIV